MAMRAWSDLNTSRRRAVYVAGVVEAVLTAAALRDLSRRPGSEVRGPKLVWALVCTVQPVGPVAYFALARR